MTEEIIISGFGGQGVLSMGKILAYAGIMEEKEVSWMPAYGPEQRGGTANVTVIVSDAPVSSPIVSAYDTAIVLNQPSLEKFEPLVKPGGTIIYDGHSIIQPPKRDDINVYMLVLGGFLKVRPIATVEDVVKGLHKALPERHHKLIPMNEEAIRRGMQLIQKMN